MNVLQSHNERVFSKHESDLGRTDLVTHYIDTGNAAPISVAPYIKSFKGNN